MSISIPSTPVPAFGKMMAFIDGENLVFRFQGMVAKGKKPNSGVVHEQDTFVWHSSSTHDCGLNQIIRSTYYTYCCGDETRVKNIEKLIKNTPYIQQRQFETQNTLYPCVFKKEKQNSKRKGVDIQMTVDILKHVYSDNVDSIFLIAGDGDYIPVIEEVIRKGKKVYLAALSDGLNDNLLSKIDHFIPLDRFYFS